MSAIEVKKAGKAAICAVLPKDIAACGSRAMDNLRKYKSCNDEVRTRLVCTERPAQVLPSLEVTGCLSELIQERTETESVWAE